MYCSDFHVNAERETRLRCNREREIPFDARSASARPRLYVIRRMRAGADYTIARGFPRKRSPVIKTIKPLAINHTARRASPPRSSTRRYRDRGSDSPSFSAYLCVLRFFSCFYSLSFGTSEFFCV